MGETAPASEHLCEGQERSKAQHTAETPEGESEEGLA